MDERIRPGLRTIDIVILWLLAIVWLVAFLAGTLINSAPYRERITAFDGTGVTLTRDTLVVVFTYTLTNVAILCMSAGVLGQLGARAILLADSHTEPNVPPDRTSPGSSAVLRSFLVYLAFLAGVLVFGETPASPTQSQYVRLAGAMSLVAFVVSYRPALFGQILERIGRVFSIAGGQTSDARNK